MEIVTGVISTLLSKLTVLLTDEYKLQRNLKKDICFLKAELESMQAALESVSKAPISDKQVRIWARDVRELSYDIEDSIDKFMVLIDTDPAAKTRGFRRSLRLLQTAKLRHRIARDIIGYKNRVVEVAERRDRYKIDTVPFVTTAATTIDPRLVGNYENTTNLVGIRGPKNELIELLMESKPTAEHHLKVISIVGAGGLGKTTVAKTVYDHLKGQFDCHAFVSVSLNPDLNRILSSILRQVSDQHYGSTETCPVEEIIDKIRIILADKRYIIILDDIWDTLAWEHIRCALAENNFSSRIITTTRVHDVALSICSKVDGAIYELKKLSWDDSKKLFYQRIFGSKDDCHSELKEVSEKILKRCGGVPLAINTISSLLADNPRDIHLWENVLNSIGSGLEKSRTVENMRNILSISYYGLPSHLKPCFLYLTSYPEDCNILKDQLIRRWISEGFIQGEDVVTSYEIGEKNFSELINRRLIEPDHIDSYGRVLACHVHDMVLDLITSLSYEENFMTALHDQKSTSVPKTVRRLSLQFSTDGHGMLKASDLSHVRSLLVFPRATNLLPLLSSFHILRVLDFEGCHDLESYQIDDVVTLFHLRCLILKDTSISILPKQIGKLCCLQTLDLRNTNISELPTTVVQLRQLVRLYIDRSVIVPVGFGGMKSLQALSHIYIYKSMNTTELGSLSELRILHISISGVWFAICESLTDSLSNLKKLHELRIVGGAISRLPRWIKSTFLRLGTLEIKIRELDQEDLQNLGALSSLYDLCLTVVEKNGSERLIVGIDQSEFQSLVKFSLSYDAMRLIFAQHAMPRLEYLELVFRVQEIKDFDVGLENLLSLKHIRTRIDCLGCRGNEVELIEGAIRKAACANSNHPRLDVIRHFEDFMIRDDERLLVHNESDEIREEIKVEKLGPWGGNGGVSWDIKVASCRLESVTICSGTIIDAIAFSYWDRNGRHHTTDFWGGTGGSADTISLGPAEFVLEVSGTVGPFFSMPAAITSLKLMTNLRSYGPFGVRQGTPFCPKVENNNCIVGFFGRSGAYLHALGVYVSPI